MKILILAVIRCSLMFTAVAALSLAYPASVQAVPTTYQYTGNPFTTAFPPYTTSDFVTVMFTLAAPLAPNTPYTTITPFAFTFSDGVQTITNLTAQLIASFGVATGADGQITAWNLSVYSDGITGNIQTNFGCPECAQTGNDGAAIYFLPFDAFALNTGPHGTWTTVGAVADTGSTLSLMTLTLMALGVAARQFKRAAASSSSTHKKGLQNMKRKSAVLALAVGFLTAASVQAVPTTYQYTGNPYTFVTGDLYTTSDFVTAMVTLARPLAPNSFFFTYTPVAFRFSDGVHTITKSSRATVFFFFSTRPTGQIRDWLVLVSDSLLRSGTQTTGEGGVIDFATFFPNDGANNRNQPGTWKMVPPRPSVGDTGSTLSLMTLTLMALGLVARRFQRAAG